MRKKYLVLLLVALVIALAGCGKKKYVAPPPAPIAPSNLTAAATSPSQVNLSWKDNSTTEKGFYVYSRTTDDYAKVAIMEANATSYNNIGLSPETTYWYKVTAYNDGGESDASNEVSVTTPVEPPPPPEPLEPPTNLTATVVSYKQINLSWRDNSDDEDGFRVRCNIGDTRTNTIATVGPNTTRYEHCKLQPMTHHKYYIEVFRGEETAGCPQVSATTPCPVTTFVWEVFHYVDIGLPDEDGNLVRVTLQIKSEASERCRVEVIVFVTDWWDDGEVIGSTKETFEVEAFGGDYYYVEVVISGPGGIGGRVYGRAEVTDVQILY